MVRISSLGLVGAREQCLPAEKGALEVGVRVVLLLLEGVAEGEDFGLIDGRGRWWCRGDGGRDGLRRFAGREGHDRNHKKCQAGDHHGLQVLGHQTLGLRRFVLYWLFHKCLS